MNLVGQQIGSYKIAAHLGSGGMGDVYRADDTKLPRSVAIKVLSNTVSDSESRARFQVEANLASSLNHPHVVTIHDAGEFEGRPYLVTEFIDGGTLRQWLHAKTRDWRQIVDLLTGVADGLASAHTIGIIHRDIKPDNILVARNGYAKIADFGLAKLSAEAAAEAVTGSNVAVHTQSGLVMGTVGYMSPEQANGKAVDARTDIFTFGVVLHESLSGHRPFAADSSLDELHRIVHSSPEPLSEEIPLPLRMIIDKALEKDPSQRYQTMREMVVDLRRLSHGSAADTPAKAVQQAGFPRAWIAVACIGVLVAILGVAFAMREHNTSSVAFPMIRSIAVLPLLNLSPDPAQEFFSDGTTEALIGSLGKIHALDVTSRTSSMRYKGTTKLLKEIARELNVDAIVEGSVQRADGRVRIMARLIDGPTEKPLWWKEFDRDVTDLLQMQDEIARTIAQEIQVKVTPDETQRLTASSSIDPAAQDAFLLGRHHYFRQEIEEVKTAIAYFEQAIKLKPDYGAAYAALWSAHAWLEPFIPQSAAAMRDAAEKAVRFAPNLAEARAALAGLHMSEWDWAAAEREFKRALELNPDSIDACGCYGTMLAALGRFPEAMKLVEHGAKVNPLSSEMHANYALAALVARRYDEAIAHAKRALELEPKNVVARIFLGTAYLDSGNPQAALTVFDTPGSAGGPGVAEAYALLGRRAEALKIANALAAAGGAPSPFALSSVYLRLGDKEHAIEWLTKAFDRREPPVIYSRVFPVFDPLRDDPRFRALVARLKMPDSPQ